MSEMDLVDDYFDDGEDDYSDEAPNPANAESDVVSAYFGSNGSVPADDYAEYDEDEFDFGEMGEEEPGLAFGPSELNEEFVTPGLVQEGFDIASKAEFMRRAGDAAAPLALLGQTAREWDAHVAARQEAQAQAEYEQGYEVFGSVVAQERQAGGLHNTADEDVHAAAEQVFAAALQGGYEDSAELAEASIRAACLLLRNQEISRSALLKA